MKIIVVCTGNTCRSPMAEAMLRRKFENAEIISRGLYVAVPSGASYNSCLVMREMGYDIDSHISCQLTEDEVLDADIILTMTASHKDKIISVMPDMAGKVFTLCEYAGKTGDIQDPFGGDIDEYRKCAAEIKKCVEEIKL